MYDSKPYPVTIEATMECIVELSNGLKCKVQTPVKASAIWHPDWQCESHNWHDEGSIEYNERDLKLKDPCEFIILDECYRNCGAKIQKILSIIDITNWSIY